MCNLYCLCFNFKCLGSSVVFMSSELYIWINSIIHVRSLQWDLLVQEYYYGKPCLIDCRSTMQTSSKCQQLQNSTVWSLQLHTVYWQCMLSVCTRYVHVFCGNSCMFLPLLTLTFHIKQNILYTIPICTL